MHKGSAALCVVLSLAGTAMAQDQGVGADVAAGKRIYERTDNNGGCIRCHGPDALGSAADEKYAGNDIRGRTAEEARIAMMALPMMWNIRIDDEELREVVAYLKYLQDASD